MTSELLSKNKKVSQKSREQNYFSAAAFQSNFKKV